MSLKRSEAVIALGKRLVGCLKAEDDLLGGWMAHHLAVLISEAETASPETLAVANAACATAVLNVWRNRNTLPDYLRPLGELEPVLATLATLSLDPESFRYHPETLRSAALAKAEGSAKKWLEVAIGLDFSARVLIGAALRAAAAEAETSAQDWVELARNAGNIEDREDALLQFLKPELDAQETQARRDRSALEDQVRRLRGIVELANGVADDLEARLECPTEASGDPPPGAPVRDK